MINPLNSSSSTISLFLKQLLDTPVNLVVNNGIGSPNLVGILRGIDENYVLLENGFFKTFNVPGPNTADLVQALLVTESSLLCLRRSDVHSIRGLKLGNEYRATAQIGHTVALCNGDNYIDALATKSPTLGYD